MDEQEDLTMHSYSVAQHRAKQNTMEITTSRTVTDKSQDNNSTRVLEMPTAMEPTLGVETTNPRVLGIPTTVEPTPGVETTKEVETTLGEVPRQVETISRNKIILSRHHFFRTMEIRHSRGHNSNRIEVNDRSEILSNTFTHHHRAISNHNENSCTDRCCTE